MIRFGTFLDDTDSTRTHLGVEDVHSAWRQWAMYCCQERGGHWWVMVGDHPDDGSGISLRCAHCPANGSDLDPCDYVVAVYGSVGDITIKSGIHDAANEFEIYVRAEVRVEQYGPSPDMIYPECDVFIDVDSA
jgi:hypothetical protein